jgi:hypothetical protein
MAVIRQAAPAPWTRPGAPRAGARPSWIGMPRVSASRPPPAKAPVMSSRPPGVRSVPPGSEGFKAPSSAPKSGSGSYVALGRPSAAPQIVTTREVELESEVAALRVEVTNLEAALVSAREQALSESEPEIVRLALAIASRVVGQEVSADPSIIARWIRQGLGLLPGREDAVVAVAPDVAGLLEDAAEADPSLSDFVVDRALAAGSCELREGTSTVEVGADGRIAAIADALGMDK